MAGNPYTNPNATLTGAASDQELGRQVRQQQAARQMADKEVSKAYDKGRVDSENALAAMLYNQVLAKQAQQGGAIPMEMENRQADTGPQELPKGIDPTGLSYAEAKAAGLVP
jgi:hypothetical protein